VDVVGCEQELLPAVVDAPETPGHKKTLQPACHKAFLAGFLPDLIRLLKEKGSLINNRIKSEAFFAYRLKKIDFTVFSENVSVYIFHVFFNQTIGFYLPHRIVLIYFHSR
jgi:hypothetical protein